MRTHRIAALLLAAALALSACSDDGPDPGESMSTWTPSGTPEEPSPSATPTAEPTEPELPDAATKATEAGARAFITYYWDLINYAQLTGDVKALKRVSGPNCDACDGINGSIEQLYRDGGRISGGENSVRVRRASELTTANDSAFGFSLKLRVEHEDQTIFVNGREPDERPSGADDFTVTLFWANNARWRLDVMELD